MSIFGSLVPNSVVEQAVLTVCNTWIDTYDSEVERQQGIAVGTLERPRSSQTSFDFENWSESQIPALVCVCPGTVGDPEKHGAGVYKFWFQVQVGVVVEDATEGDARRVAQLHQAAIDGLLIQHGTLGGFAEDFELVSRQSHLPDVANRTLAYAESTYRVLVDEIVARPGGPPYPDAPQTDPEAPYGDWPEVASTEVDVTGVPDGTLIVE